MTVFISCSSNSKVFIVEGIAVEVLDVIKFNDGAFFLKMGSKSNLKENLEFFEVLKKAFNQQATILCKPNIYDNNTIFAFLSKVAVDSKSNLQAWQFIEGNINCLKK